MGFFSWRKSDDNKTVANKYTDRGATPCKMILPDGFEYIEHNYEGYGVFGDHDWFEVVDKLNGGDGDRERGIKIDLCPDPGIIRPKLVNIDCKTPWADLPDSPICDTQGFWL